MQHESLLKWAQDYGPEIIRGTPEDSDDDNEDDICHSPEVFNLVCRVAYVTRRGWTKDAMNQFQLDRYLTQVSNFLDKKEEKTLLKKMIIYLHKVCAVRPQLVGEIMHWLYPPPLLALFQSVEPSKSVQKVP